MPVFDVSMAEALAEQVKMELAPGEAEAFAKALSAASAGWDAVAAFSAPADAAPWHPEAHGNLWREDEIIPSLTPDEATAHSGRTGTDLFRVPEIL